jgi:SAM-dependent methyltransferase
VHYEANRFDLVRLNNVIEHLPSPKALVRAVHRILRLFGGGTGRILAGKITSTCLVPRPLPVCWRIAASAPFGQEPRVYTWL